MKRAAIQIQGMDRWGCSGNSSLALLFQGQTGRQAGSPNKPISRNVALDPENINETELSPSLLAGSDERLERERGPRPQVLIVA